MKARHSEMVKKVCIVLPFYLLTFLPLNAQTFTQRVQQSQQGQGTLRIHHDADIDKLVNGPKPIEKPKPKEQPKEKKEEKQQQPAKQANPQRDNTHQDEPVDTLAQKNKRMRKTMGFRVQVFEGGSSRQDRSKAERIGGALRQLFPTEAVYVHFSKPRWVCRIGDFTTLEDAQQMLAEVRKSGYPNATILRDRVNVPYEQ